MTDEEHIRARLNRARTFMDACYNQPLDLECIAGEASFSRYHFIRLFKQTFDQTPHQYLIHRRIEQAKALLTMGDFRWLTVGSKDGSGPELILYATKTHGGMMDEATIGHLRAVLEKGLMGPGVFETDNCYATYEDLKSKGVEFVSPP
ncbi:MAG TPA: AraC family transcriptional regulator, partial [Roseiflexaceae bacterium]|nr:AraC family transcriptional regulator [Roseiflexaceae bacterium]